MIPKPNYISTTEIARQLGLSHAAVLKRIRKGQIRAVKIGRSYAIPKSYLKEQFPDIEVQIPVEGEYLSIMEAAKILQLTRMAVFKRIKSGKLEAKRVGRHYVIAKDQVFQTKAAALERKIEVDKEYLSVPELAKVLGISRISVFKQIQQGKIKAERVGRHYSIAVSDISAFGITTKEAAMPAGAYVPVIEAAKVLGISRIAVFKRIKKGQIEAIKIGRSFAIKRQDLRSFLMKEHRT